MPVQGSLNKSLPALNYLFEESNTYAGNLYNDLLQRIFFSFFAYIGFQKWNVWIDYVLEEGAI